MRDVRDGDDPWDTSKADLWDAREPQRAGKRDPVRPLPDSPALGGVIVDELQAALEDGLGVVIQRRDVITVGTLADRDLAAG
jgi:hypothetical protein